MHLVPALGRLKKLLKPNTVALGQGQTKLS